MKARPILGDLNFEFQYSFILLLIIIIIIIFFGGWGGGVQKIESLWRMQIMWIFFGGHHKTRLLLGFIFMHLQVFFKFNV